MTTCLEILNKPKDADKFTVETIKNILDYLSDKFPDESDHCDSKEIEYRRNKILDIKSRIGSLKLESKQDAMANMIFEYHMRFEDTSFKHLFDSMDDCRKIVRAIYGMRSAIAHGSNIKEEKYANKFWDNYNKLQSIVYNILYCKFIDTHLNTNT